MHCTRCLRINHLIWQSRLHLNAFKSRKLSQCWVFKRSFFCSCRHFHLLHLRISMRVHQLHLLWSSILRFRKTIAWSDHLWFLNIEKWIDDVCRWRNDSFKSRQS
jgi:hypothetical protein